MSKLVSIIMPTYNAGEYISEAIDSIYKQTYTNYEIFVIDDGSTDNTKYILEKYNENPNFKYIRLEHSGLAAKARNHALKLAQGHYLAFLDADDVWMTNKLEEQIKEFEKDVALVYSDGELIDQNLKFSDLEKFHRGQIFQRLILRNFIATSSVIVKKSVIDEMGGFSENPNFRVGEDYDLWLKIAQKYPVDYSKKNLFRYRINMSGLSKDKRKAYLNIAHVYKKWLKQPLTASQKILFLIALLKNYLKIVYKTF